MLAAYRGLATASAPALRLYLAWRVRQGKEDPARRGERLGIASAGRPAGSLVWTHAASVGEAVSALPVIERLAADPRGFAQLVTTGTTSSAALLGGRLPARTVHQYLPVDRPAWVRRFLDHWRPDLALWLESEIWPVALGEMAGRRIPAILLNGRMSARSAAHWRHVPRDIRALLDSFSLILAQSDGDAERLRGLGATAPRCLGNLKSAAAPLAADESEVAALADCIGARPVWAAVSTHPGEEQIVAETHLQLAARHQGLLTIVAPRHATRGGEVAETLAGMGLAVARRSLGERPGAETEIYLADTMGELGLVYRLSGIAFMGGSLVPHGGQNPLEAARLGCAILNGPHIGNFTDAYAALADAGAAETVADAAALADSTGRLLAEPARLARRRAAALAAVASDDGVLAAIMAELEPFLAAIGGPPQPEARHARA